MSLTFVLSSAAELTSVYLVKITAFKTIKYWLPDPSSPATSYETSIPFDGNAFVTNVFYGDSTTLVNSQPVSAPLSEVASEAAVKTTPGSWYWDRTNLFVQTLLSTDPRVDTNTVTVELTYYFCTHTAKIFNNIYYQPLLKSVPERSLRVEQDFSGVAQISAGATVLDNSTGFFDTLTDLDWDGGQTVVMLGADQPTIGVYMDYSDYVPIGTWLNDNWTKTNQDFTINNFEIKYRLTQNMPQRIYSPDIYPDMFVNAIGQPIPLAYGHIFGAAPVCIDVNNKVFKLADHAIFGIDEVRIASNSSWIPVSPDSLDLANGQFTYSSWDGQSNISVDFHGKTNADGSWMDNASDQVRDILGFIGESNLNRSSFDTSHNNLVIGSGPGSTGNTTLAVSSVSLPSAGSYVDAPYDSALDVVTGDFTIEGWIYQPVANMNNGLFNRGDGSGTQGPLGFGFFTGGNTQLCIRFNDNDFTLAGSFVPIGQWCHVAAQREGSVVSIFMNGIPSSGGTGSYATPIAYSGEKVFAGMYFDTPFSFIGDISELRFSKVARYSGPFTPPSFLGTDANTVLYWKFDEGTGTSAVDSSASGITGTLRGAATWVDRIQGSGIEISNLVPSIYIDTVMSAQDVFQRINQTVGSYLFVDANGTYRYVVFQPQPGEGLDTFDQTSIKTFKKDKPSIQCQSLITGSFANRLQDGWGQVLTESNTPTQYSKGYPAPVYSGSNTVYLSTEDDALYWILRQLIFFGQKPGIYTIDLPWAALLHLPTDQIHIVYPRHSLDAILEVVEINTAQDMIQVVVSNLHNFDSSTGFWMEDTDVLPTRFSNLAGYGAGSLTWNDSWADEIKIWWIQNCGGWTDDNGFVSSTDPESLLASVYF